MSDQPPKDAKPLPRGVWELTPEELAVYQGPPLRQTMTFEETKIWIAHGQKWPRPSDPKPPQKPKPETSPGKVSTLAGLVKISPMAVVVYHALRLLSVKAGKSHVTPTRKRLMEITGIERIATISRCLSLLAKHGWIRKRNVKVRGCAAEIIRITLNDIHEKLLEDEKT